MKIVLAGVALPILVGLSGCPSSASATSGDAVFVTQDDVRDAYGLIDLPYFIAFGLTPKPEMPQTCPRVTRTADGWFATGDCTDATTGSSYEGEVRVTQRASSNGISYTFKYVGFAARSARWSTVIDGQIRADIQPSDCGFPGPAPLEADGLRVTVEGDAIEGKAGWFPGAGRSLEATFSSFSYGWDLACEPATLSAHGMVALAGKGTFSLDLSRVEGRACQGEPLSGSATFVGANVATLRFDGESRCDRCWPLNIDEVPGGDLCGPAM
jgi:hypothetical protein